MCPVHISVQNSPDLIVFVVFSALVENARIVVHSSTVLIHSVIIQCDVNLTPNTDDLKETGWQVGNNTDLAQDRRVAVSFLKGVEASNFH
jgi:hypothetical protein